MLAPVIYLAAVNAVLLFVLGRIRVSPLVDLPQEQVATVAGIQLSRK